MKKVLSVMIIAAGVFATPAQAQDIHFSQFYENAIMRNPALTGIFSGDYKGGVNFRNQWGNLSVPFITVLANAESRIAINKEVGDYLSFGVTATYDKAGSINFTSMQVYPSLNYNKSLEDEHQTYISVGFAGGYIQRSFDASKMTVSNQWQNNAYNPNLPTGEANSFRKIQHFDVSAGLSLNGSMGSENSVNYYLGVAAYHLTKPKETFDENEDFVRLSTRWVGNMGIQARIKGKFGLTLHLNYQNQNPYQEIIGGGFLSYRVVDANKGLNASVGLGCFYRVGDAVIPSLRLDYNQYSFVGSYDVNNSSLRTASEGVGGFEFSIYVRGRLKKNEGTRYSCPRFENDLIPEDRQ